MKYSAALYDTSVFISYDLPRPAGWLSAVVLQELAVGANRIMKRGGACYCLILTPGGWPDAFSITGSVI